MSEKNAFITGISGQDGSYLAEFLLKNGYEVHGLIRRTSSGRNNRVDRVQDVIPEDTGRLHFHYGDLSNSDNLPGLIEAIEPDEVYNLAAQSNVAVSFQQPEYTADVNALGVLRLLNPIRDTHPEARVYQASTCEMFGSAEEAPQSENTGFHPENPYGCAKLYAHHIVRTYRDAHDLFAASGIQFNHESPRRGKQFVTRKITHAAARIASGKQDRLYLGNLDARRDWGYAPEYVEAMWRMLQLDEPDEFVIATGETHSVREFAGLAFEIAGMKLEWKGEGVEERAVDVRSGDVVVEVNPAFYRPVDVRRMVGDASKAKETFGWNPETEFEELVRIMVESDLEAVD